MNKPITEYFEELPKIVKILLVIFLGGLIGGVYRILRYLETKNITTLIVGILWLVSGGVFGFGWIIDLITEITKDRITVLAA